MSWLYAYHQKRADKQAVRDAEPWRWYCRICGAEGSEPNREDRDRIAKDHVDIDCRCRTQRNRARSESGHLLHIWRY